MISIHIYCFFKGPESSAELFDRDRLPDSARLAGVQLLQADEQPGLRRQGLCLRLRVPEDKKVVVV